MPCCCDPLIAQFSIKNSFEPEYMGFTTIPCLFCSRANEAKLTCSMPRGISLIPNSLELVMSVSVILRDFNSFPPIRILPFWLLVIFDRAMLISPPK